MGRYLLAALLVQTLAKTIKKNIYTKIGFRLILSSANKASGTASPEADTAHIVKDFEG